MTPYDDVLHTDGMVANQQTSGRRIAELRRSNAAGKHRDRRTRRRRTRATVRSASLKEQE